ncbi:thioredoxin family protein [Nereida sp. MMG025]|uniref:DUF1223 domain-containing protein n=1 Tax=Nereida sp. MMG025 TaxID=2909981 RepID=UPI001F1FFCAD|nr:DUF1223 domain-containing protein [Nereida sp. MMG025]MCF6443397.1 DUF1223 domain-containing protein [Nereida sp. MMG025]
MRALTLAFALALFPLAALADDHPVVLELFTSQGCSSCPPADKLLHELADRDDVIALALHVDYWDYIGWKDVFANPAFTERQKGYARAAGSRSIYTPQMVIGGSDHVVGYKPMKVAEMLRKHSELQEVVSVSIDRDGAALNIAARTDAPQDMVVHLVRYQPSETVDIKRGENRGKTFEYANIVREWHVLETWDGQADLTLQADVDGDMPIVVLVQKSESGAVLGAARLR